MFLILQVSIILFGISVICSENGFVSQITLQQLFSPGVSSFSANEDTNASGDISHKIARYLQRFGYWTPVLFWLASFISAMLFVPVTVAAVLSGLLFGKLSGTLLLATSVAAASMMALLIGRKLNPRFLTRYSNHARSQVWIDYLENLLNKNGFTAFFILRNIPHPFILVSYLAGLIKTVDLWAFGSATFLVLLLRGFAFVYFGDNLLKGPKALIFPAVLIIACILLSVLCKGRVETKR